MHNNFLQHKAALKDAVLAAGLEKVESYHEQKVKWTIILKITN